MCTSECVNATVNDTTENSVASNMQTCQMNELIASKTESKAMPLNIKTNNPHQIETHLCRHSLDRLRTSKIKLNERTVARKQVSSIYKYEISKS